MPDAVDQSEEITRQSRSNLALAFVLLPRDRRRDITVFYAFCRLLDDLMDEPDRPAELKLRGLRRWRELVLGSTPAGSGDPDLNQLAPEALAAEVRHIIAKYNIPLEHFEELIAGVEMDREPARYATWEDLRLYCYRVASAVGLISVEIFGYRDPRTREYAVALGYALQLTNIIRDVAKDARNDGRIYLPRDLMERFGVTEAELLAERPGPQFAPMMAELTRLAQDYYAQSRRLLPPGDRRSLVAAELMRRVYSKLLGIIAADDFRVFEREYKLKRSQKLAALARAFAGKVIGI